MQLSQPPAGNRWREDPWRYRLAAVVLAPLLLAQAVHVRRTTVRLPEPPGPRTGTEGVGPSLRVLIAGDSAAAGVGAASQQEGLAGAVVGALRGDFTVEWTLLANTGLKTRDLLARLEAAPPAHYDVVLLSLGVNDVTGGTPSKAFLAHQYRLVEVLASRFGARLLMLTSLPPMHVFPALPQPLRWVLGARARAFTRLLDSLAAAHDACVLLTPDLPLDLAYIASDGFHPGPQAYAAWGRQAAELIRSRFPGGS